MILEIVHYGHPALRAKGTRVEKIDAGIRDLAEDMIETMYDADGVGLAAQQIGRPLQLCVIDVTGAKDRPSALRIGGKAVEIEPFMPMVLVNPEIEPFGKPRASNEGCLSFPGLQGEITRPWSVRVRAKGLDGQPVEFESDGLLARAIQHEYDHLQGMLFIDRMSAGQRRELDPEIEQIRTANAA